MKLRAERSELRASRSRLGTRRARRPLECIEDSRKDRIQEASDEDVLVHPEAQLSAKRLSGYQRLQHTHHGVPCKRERWGSHDVQQREARPEWPRPRVQRDEPIEHECDCDA